MLDEITLEKRLVTLDQAIKELQDKLESSATSPNWLEKLTGSISDEEAFLQALEYGRAFQLTNRLI
jgi:hypothetical protein